MSAQSLNLKAFQRQRSARKLQGEEALNESVHKHIVSPNDV
jgi:hypothetical protein